MHGKKAEEAFHEPEGRARQSPARRLCIAKLRRARSDAPYRFMVPMHAEKTRKRAFHEPERRTPVRHGVVCSPSGNRAEREFGAPLFGSWSRCMRKKRKGAFHEPTKLPGEFV